MLAHCSNLNLLKVVSMLKDVQDVALFPTMKKRNVYCEMPSNLPFSSLLIRMQKFWCIKNL